MTVVKDIPEPKWAKLLQERSERAAAKLHWKRVTDEMRERETLSPSNGHSVQRLVLAYIIYDRCSAEVGAGGVVTAPSKENPKAIARLSVFYQAMREAESTAERLENQLGLTPQRRGKVAKVTRKRERSAGADAFLGPKS